MKRILIGVVLAAMFAFVMVSCNQPIEAQPSVDLGPIEESLARLEEKVDALAVEVERANAGIVDLDASLSGRFDQVQSDFASLNDAALDLQALVTAPIDLSRIDISSVEGFFLTVSPPDLQVEIKSGPCPDGTQPPRALKRADMILAATYHPAPAGLHCLLAPESETTLANGYTFEVPEGSLANVTMIPHEKTVEGQ